jgi:hypothetical protein
VGPAAQCARFSFQTESNLFQTDSNLPQTLTNKTSIERPKPYSKNSK